VSVEERMNDALLDFESLVIEGLTADEAAQRAGTDHGFTAEALLSRAQKRFGELKTLKVRRDTVARSVQRTAKIREAVCRYNRDNFGPTERTTFIEIEDWVEGELGITLDQNERLFAREELQQAFHRSMVRDLEVLLREEMTENNA